MGFGMGGLLGFSVPQFRLAGAHSNTIRISYAKCQVLFGLKGTGRFNFGKFLGSGRRSGLGP